MLPTLVTYKALKISSCLFLMLTSLTVSSQVDSIVKAKFAENILQNEEEYLKSVNIFLKPKLKQIGVQTNFNVNTLSSLYIQ